MNNKKGETCTRCGDKLAYGTEKWLELSLTDGNYYDKLPHSHKSQGNFPFGEGCCKKQLQETDMRIYGPREQIYVEKFQIDYSGDWTVGIRDVQWHIQGGFYFDNENQIEEFKNKLREAWELVSDTPFTVTGFIYKITEV